MTSTAMIATPPAKPANKHELRTRETRSLLLHAAETIFVRDGYEGAELGQIATLAGRTKGAIYAQFKSKEDIFLALIDDRTQRSRAQMEKALAKASTVEGNIEVLRAFFLERTEDRAWSLLMLEFKLYCLRHPESRKRLLSHYADVFPGNEEARFAEYLGPAPKGREAISRSLAVKVLHPIISALVLESQLDGITEKNAVRKVTNRLFDALLERHTQ